jgi:23S rRNA pseudouridine1911/1915/1917 synthase
MQTMPAMAVSVRAFEAADNLETNMSINLPVTCSEPTLPIISAQSSADPVGPDLAEELDEAVNVELREVVLPISAHASRLDRALADSVPEFSRSYLQQLIENGGVTIDGAVVTKVSSRVKAGQHLCIELKPTPQSQAFKPENLALDVVFEDDHLLVLNKQAGLVVHPAPGNWQGTLLNGLLGRDSQACFLPRAGIVHRLDKDTSGLMVVAKQRKTMDQLVAMIAARDVSREYLALGHGQWTGAKNRLVDFPIGRDPRNRLRMAVVDLEKNAGKLASTRFSLEQTDDTFCLVRCKLHTGRTHQIRVHMAEIGHPLVADETYGGRVALDMARQALHACRLAFAHPHTGEALAFTADPPQDMLSALASRGLRYNISNA